MSNDAKTSLTHFFKGGPPKKTSVLTMFFQPCLIERLLEDSFAREKCKVGSVRYPKTLVCTGRFHKKHPSNNKTPNDI